MNTNIQSKQQNQGYHHQFRGLIFALLVLILFDSCSQETAADRIYFNAKIWTGDSATKLATAIAVKDSLLVYVGDDYQSFKGSSTEMIDMNGQMIVPGFIDNHTHFLTGGNNLSGVQLRNAGTREEFISILKAFCQQHTDERWILGGNWDHENWGGLLPDKSWIDSVTGNHPLFVNRYDGHMAFANTKALQLAGITGETKSPPGGEIVKDKDGNPTGVLKDEAMNIMYTLIPDPSEKELDEFFEAASRFAIANGVTQVHDMGSYGGWLDLDTYRRARQDSKQSLRIYSFVPLGHWQRMDSFCKRNGKGDDMLRWGGLKGFTDGSLGSTTAWFYQPYLDAPKFSGFPVTDTTLLRNWVLSADSSGLHVTVHAIGDRANDFILRVFQEASAKNSAWDHRFRIEHAQHLAQYAIPEFARSKIIASMQPYHAIDDGRWAAKRLEDARLKGTYAFNDLLKSGAMLTFGSDWPVAPAIPLEGIDAAVNRQTLDGKNPGGWYPGQKISLEQALKAYTSSNAYAGFQEKKLGMLKAGMLADFVVLSDDILSIGTDKIKQVKVVRTIINGKEVYSLSH